MTYSFEHISMILANQCGMGLLVEKRKKYFPNPETSIKVAGREKCKRYLKVLLLKSTDSLQIN
jgi:hypothetical protein